MIACRYMIDRGHLFQDATHSTSYFVHETSTLCTRLVRDLCSSFLSMRRDMYDFYPVNLSATNYGPIKLSHAQQLSVMSSLISCNTCRSSLAAVSHRCSDWFKVRRPASTCSILQDAAHEQQTRVDHGYTAFDAFTGW